MKLADRLSEELKQAMRDKDKVRLSVLRLIKAAMKNQEIESHHALSDEEILSVIRKEVKQRKDALEAVKGSERADFIASVEAELEVLSSYLPAPLALDEIRSIVLDVVRETGASSRADMGKVMPVVMERVGSRAEGKTVSQVVQEVLASRSAAHE
ncbi:GatB/YqeY domain-containing protein [Sulfoacidibacillus thermotolerans]|uniref:Aspartyl-tRNA amidotransferase n=1 Tax=Sulfoacidibacillus thermotolerans TaxID=1765684 RepID=A0A2U3D6E6_SULT2|nr:GatB/YqeY domain-containing protein [Sulfoacidibacillus thermotolerans]PWI56843.1 aspartyl-tRNA amidotransferase [Sulfoacidibacillus thermotolerans]